MKRWICIVIPLIVLSLLIGWRLSEKRAEGEAQNEMRSKRMNAPLVVTLSPVVRRDVAHTFEATGTVEAPLNVKIAPKVSGRIESLELHEGDRVKRGQVLVKIDPSEVEANVQQQVASLAEAQYRLAQAQVSQNPADVAVNTQIRQQRAGVDSAKADVNQARQNYEASLAAASAGLDDAQAKIGNAKAAVKGAEANLENAKAKYNRIMDLYKQGFIAAQEVDDAKTAMSVQESAVEIANGQLNSAIAQKKSADQQVNIVKAKGNADVESARAKMTQSKASLEYAQANTAQKSAYQQSISALRSSVAAARASLRSAQARRADTVLISPMDGYVTGRYADPGAMASPSQAVLDVQFIKQVWVTLAVPEEVSAQIHLGQPAQVRFDALPGKSFAGSVIQVNPSADTQSRQFSVRVIMSNEQGLFKPGMFARVSIETDRVKAAVVVPREAIKRDEKGPYVVTVGKGNKAKRISVETGVSDTKYIAINQGLTLGDQVVTMSAFPARDGQMLIPGGGPGRGGKHGRGGAKR